MTPQKPTTTLPFKIIYLGLMVIMALIVLAGSYVMLDDPRFKTVSLKSNLKSWYYTTTFLSASAFDSVEVRNSTVTTAHSVPVLAYHGITEKPDGTSINLTESQFKDHMFALKRAGYTAITLSDLHAFAKGEKQLPLHPVLITFDDGRTDTFYNADPILDAVGYQASMFVITDITEAAKQGGYYLSKDEVKHMAKNGRWEIGSHSANAHDQHPINASGDRGNFFSNHIWLESEGRIETEEEFRKRIANDFSASQQYLEELLGNEVRVFAFPFGDFGQNQLDNREKSREIYDAAVAVYDILLYQQRPGEYFTQFTPSLQKNNGKFLVKRINMQNSWSAEELLDILHDGEEKALPYTEAFARNDGWIKVWGDRTITNGALTLKAPSDSSGASTVLDGSQYWSDYEVTAEVTSPARTGVFLWTRFQNDSTHAGCNFGTHFVHVEQTINGVKRVLKGVERSENIPAGPFTVSARVDGRTLICSMNGEEIVRTEFLEPTLTQGGTGIKIWDSVLGKSMLNITKFEVKSVNSEE